MAVRLPEHGRADEQTLARLHPDEAAAAADMSEHRARTYVGGRLALRAALRAAGVDAAAAILTNESGAPRLPTGAWGSISHKSTLAIAVAQVATGEGALGIDLEHDGPGQIDISRRVLRAEELAAVTGTTDGERMTYARRAFSIKEAVYKAGHPLAQRFFGFQEAQVDVPIGVRMSEFYQVQTRLVPDGWRPDFAMTSYFYVMSNWVVSVVLALRNTETALRNNGLDGR
ncbi:MAG: 4'-phosphopantetheinyl transferase superfamily protein [Deltaproteobacteria bacterium]|nr:4'-phosphopantetheinyl transferase superfamily protein [Deltaproteobacteria bacterium]